MHVTETKTAMLLVGVLAIAQVCVGESTNEAARRMLAERTATVARVEKAELPKAQLADLIDQADMIVVIDAYGKPMR